MVRAGRSVLSPALFRTVRGFQPGRGDRRDGKGYNRNIDSDSTPYTIYNLQAGDDTIMQTENTVTVSGTLHLIQRDASEAARRSTFLSRPSGNPGGRRERPKDFLLARIYDPEIQSALEGSAGRSTHWIHGDVRSSSAVGRCTSTY